MVYLSLDIETTGLDPDTCDVLEVGIYYEDTEVRASRDRLPCFHQYIWKDTYNGEPYALAMNQRIFQKILDLRKQHLKGEDTPEFCPHVDLLADRFYQWLARYDIKLPIPIGGKNVAGFDLPFMKNFQGWSQFKFHHRVIDPGMLYFNALNDKVPPDLKECKRRAKLPEVVSHEALDDAWDVIQLVREKFPII